jgi:hypothetical protein
MFKEGPTKENTTTSNTVAFERPLGKRFVNTWRTGCDTIRFRNQAGYANELPYLSDRELMW